MDGFVSIDDLSWFADIDAMKARLTEARLPHIPKQHTPDPQVYCRLWTMYRPNTYLLTAADEREEGLLLYGYLLQRDNGWKHLYLEELQASSCAIDNSFSPTRLSLVYPELELPVQQAAKDTLLMYPRSNRIPPLPGTAFGKRDLRLRS